MTATATAEKPTITVAPLPTSKGELVLVSPKVDAFKSRVLPEEKARLLYTALPSHISPERFDRNLINALMANPDLLDCDPLMVYREVSKAAGLGLLLDPQLGEAYIIIGYNGKTQRKEPQLRIGYKGMCKLARQTGSVSTIYAHEVCAADKIECHMGTEKRLVHTPKLFTDRGLVVGFYAVINFKDGSFDFEPMSVGQTQAIRDRSDAWKAFKANKIKSTPWSTDEDEMAKKTVLRRLLKRQDQSPELATAIRIETEAENDDDHDFHPVRQVAAPVQPPEPPDGAAQIEAPKAAAAPEATQKPADEPEASFVDLMGNTSTVMATAAPPPEPPEPPDSEDPAPKTTKPKTQRSKPSVKSMSTAETEQWLTDVGAELDQCASLDDVEAAVAKVMTNFKAVVFPPDWERAEKLLRTAMKRVTGQ